MIGCYATGVFPRPKELVEATRAYERRKINDENLEKIFHKATLKIVQAQISANFSYVTDGMLKWQDLLRPFTEKLHGVRVGALARWFSNNTFYRKPVVVEEIRREKDVTAEMVCFECLPKNVLWKAILPAPYTFAKLAENRFYRNDTELMFKFAEILKAEIKTLTKKGFSYIQLSDPALVYNPFKRPISKDTLIAVRDALETAIRGTAVRTCLQTFFGDFSQILPEALDFPVTDLGIDLYETKFEKLKEYKFGKGIALGLVDARNSLVEDENELVNVAKELIGQVYLLEKRDIFICPNCDLDFLPWERAEEKLMVAGNVAKRLKAELNIHG